MAFPSRVRIVVASLERSLYPAGYRGNFPAKSHWQEPRHISLLSLYSRADDADVDPSADHRLCPLDPVLPNELFQIVQIFHSPNPHLAGVTPPFIDKNRDVQPGLFPDGLFDYKGIQFMHIRFV